MMLKYLEWISSDVAECFFPITKKEDRRFRWPGLGRAVRCLVLEAMCLLVASYLFTMMTLGYGLFLMTGYIHDAVIPGLPLASGPKGGELFPVTRLDAKVDKLTPTMIQGFISRSEPLVIKNLPKEAFSTLTPGGQYAPHLPQELIDKGTIIVNPYLFPRALGGFGEWIQKYVHQRVITLVRFSGSYKSGYAHIDGYTNNIYYLARGRKRVWICPRQYTHLLNFQSIPNSIVVPGSDHASPNPLSWIQSVPGVWALDLEAGDVLIFNNAGCAHKFENVSVNPEGFSMRVFNTDIAPVLAKHHIFNWEQARLFAMFAISTLSNKTLETRDSVEGVSSEYSDESIQVD